jgi:hypothetical protein
MNAAERTVTAVVTREPLAKCQAFGFPHAVATLEGHFVFEGRVD